MLSYRHGFHAGNHADVLKHMVLCLILRQLKQKGKPLTYIDTHSGAGAYSLKSAWSQQTGEYKNGVDKIINNSLLQGVFNTGLEFIYANTVALRLGYLYDQTGKRNEADFGIGFMISDVLQFDLATIMDVGDNDGVRDGQMRFGALFKF